MQEQFKDKSPIWRYSSKRENSSKINHQYEGTVPVPSYWWFIFELFLHIGDLSLNCSFILVIYLWTVFSLWTVPSYWWFIFELFLHMVIYLLTVFSLWTVPSNWWFIFQLFFHIGDLSLNFSYHQYEGTVER
jgi:uncharacterized membrane protein (GlpM family)